MKHARLALLVVFAVLSPAWGQSQRHGRILFIDSGPRKDMICVCRADGSGLKVLGEGEDAAFAPDGRSIVFVRSDGRKSAVWRMGADGANPRKLFEMAGEVFGPALSPDGKRIAYAVQKTPGDLPYAVVSGLDGSGPRRIGGLASYSPCWSPDGRRLAVPGMVSEGRSGISIVDADRLHGRFVHTGQAPPYYVAWSRDRIAWLTLESGGAKIYVARPDGRGRAEVAGGAVGRAGLAFSDDGRTLYWTRFIDGKGSEIRARTGTQAARTVLVSPSDHAWILDGGYFLRFYRAVGRLHPD
jgi:TolB protein